MQAQENRQAAQQATLLVPTKLGSLEGVISRTFRYGYLVDFVPIANHLRPLPTKSGFRPWASGVTNFRGVTGVQGRNVFTAALLMRLLAAPPSWGRLQTNRAETVEIRSTSRYRSLCTNH